MLRTLICIFTSLLVLAAQTAQKWPIATLKIEGNQNYSEPQILAITGLKPGDLVGKAEFEAARDRLLATGAFETVGYRFEPVQGGKGYAASFQVTEIQPLLPFRFEALHADTKALTEYLRRTEPLFAEKLPATKEMLGRLTKSVEQFLSQAGAPQEIIAKVATPEPGKLEIVIQPASLPSVAEIDFKGNTTISTQTLREAVAGAAVGAVYTEPRFRQILDASARPVYEAQGRLRAEWTKIDVVPAKSVKGLAVTVHVNEGEEYKLRKVELAKVDEEDKAALQGDAILKEGGFDVGAVANFSKIRQGVEKMEQSLRRKGFLEVKSKTERKIDDKEKSVDLMLHVDPGPQFLFGKLTIEGLDIETEPHIQKLWAIKKGQPFNAEYPDFFLNKIREDQIFDNLGRTKAITRPEPANNTVDVTLIFEGEKRPEKPKQP
jgi:outer membrane protein insertion porin family